VTAGAYARKARGGSIGEQRLGLILSRSRGSERMRRKKLADFQAFLNAYQASQQTEAIDLKIKGLMTKIYQAGKNTPFDMVMWLLHEEELENRGLYHLLPDKEEE
jgi:hypothetical protein